MRLHLEGAENKLVRARAIETAVVVSTEQVASQTFVTRFLSAHIAPLVRPGQFVMVSYLDCLDPLLPRAFSVSDVKGKTLSLLYNAIGKSTKRMSKLEKGESVSINGPLGHGFPEFEKGKSVWTVLGGSGAALIPILSKFARRQGCSLKIFYGAKTKRELVNFEGIKTAAATDDGTKGYSGTVVELVAEKLKRNKPDEIFACGPTAMLKATAIAIEDKVPLYVSVETPMACGMGFCQGCPVRITSSGDYFLACKDGPVFKSTEIEI